MSSKNSINFLNLTFYLLITLNIILNISLINGYILKEDESFLNDPHYRSQNEIEDLFTRLEKYFPDIAKLFVIGRSLQGQNLLVLKISRNINKRNLLIPMIKYIANMHGDETIGREMLIYLTEYLLFNDGKIPDVTKLIDTTDIYIMPTMNPDGFSISQEGSCNSLPGFVGRNNANGIDLNRDFPDRLDNSTIDRARQPETSAVINWITSNPFVLSANFHGGAVVASYPYDNSIKHRDCCIESVTPDNNMFKKMASTYSINHPIMRNGHNCNDSFNNGITNGAFWYELNGGMQDFNYAFTNCFELTIELSCCKYPYASVLPEEWKRNKRSLLEFIKLAHVGIKGLITDLNGYPIADAKLVVEGLEGKPILSTDRGEYWRLLTPGQYKIQAQAFGFQPSEVKTIEIGENQLATRIDFALKPAEFNDGAYRTVVRQRKGQDKYGFIQPPEFIHHNFVAMEAFIRKLSETYPILTYMYSIGKSVQGRNLWVLAIGKNPKQHTPGIPEFKYVANMHGNEVVGREMLLLLAKYLCENYGINERVTKLVNDTRIHLLFSMNPDGYEMSVLEDKYSYGRTNANNVDLNRNFPDQYGINNFNAKQEVETLAVMNWTLSIPFVLSANLHGGSLVANYPYDDTEESFKNEVLSRLVHAERNPTEDNDIFVHLAKTYSNSHPTMHLGEPCPKFPLEKFKNGITNGAQWYSVTGGMQDWNYIKAGCFELTLELSCEKYPKSSELPDFWEANREPLLKYMEQIHGAVHGYIKSSIGHPVAGAKIWIDGRKMFSHTGINGDYWRLVLPGKHNITVIADSYEPHIQEFEIKGNGSISLRLDISLMHDDAQHWASAHDYRIIQHVVNTKYYTNSQINRQMNELQRLNIDFVAFEAGGDTNIPKKYHSLKVTSSIGSPEETKFHILILSSVFSSIPVGRELTMNLARHIIAGNKEPPVGKLLNNTVIHFLPVMEGFEDIYNQYMSNPSICDPEVENELAASIVSPESQPQRNLLLKMLDNEGFDLILSFSSGGSNIYYPQPKNDSVEIYPKLAKTVQTTQQSEFLISPPKPCPSSKLRSNQNEIVQKITNLFYDIYHIPMLTLEVSCCRMPVAKDIGTVWRENLDKLLNFLYLTETGIKGYVKNKRGQPVRNAHVQISGQKSRVQSVTRNLAHFRLILPPGKFDLIVKASGHKTKIISLEVYKGLINNLGDVFLDIGRNNESEHIDFTPKTQQQKEGNFNDATITGFVLDNLNHPIQNAKVSIISPDLPHTTFSDSSGIYTLKDIPAGDVTLKAEAPGHEFGTRLVHVGTFGGETIRGVIFRLEIDDRIWGLPRLLFIVSTGCILVLLIVCCAMCVQFVGAKTNKITGTARPHYNFSILSQKGNPKRLFDDDEDDLDETELFRSPIKRGIKATPYYDDDRDPIIDTDEEDESEEDIVMLNKNGNNCD
ncbi:carboxypeptidase D isoform X3 [Condylostylus longicornis]|uniref:carboxypeptidase D isoform X3 n=1 Tax=Condylostylus longicornis TaxID=2530218 RepID=UPI00244E3593|nr:carboxypeptidase D isoform X3 [Condylostylus longicornis]